MILSGRGMMCGNKQGFLEATIEFALKRDELKDEFTAYLKDIVKTL
jgi:UTP--glucose-1-phosphate uridylyltransferase